MDPCVRSILCGLSQPIRTAISALASAQVALLTAQLTALEAFLLQLQIQNLPITLTRDLAEQARSAAEATFAFVPFDLFRGCLDLGTLSLNLSASLDAVLVDVDRVLREAERRLSVEEEIRGSIQALETAITYYGDLVTEIGLC